jgi:hypothetical protein
MQSQTKEKRVDMEGATNRKCMAKEIEGSRRHALITK